jgi:hypothetical protein
MLSLKKTTPWLLMLALALPLVTHAQNQNVESQAMQTWSNLDQILQGEGLDARKQSFAEFMQQISTELRARANAADQSEAYWRLRGIGHKVKMIANSDCNTANKILRSEESNMQTNDSNQIGSDGQQALKVLQVLCSQQ